MAMRKFRIKIDGKIFMAEVEEIGEAKKASPATAVTKTASSATSIAAPISGNTVVAPMPGKVIAIKVSKGQKVNAGDVVVVIEAMKMEQEIKTALEGTVSEISISEGETVKKEQPLVVID